MCNLPRAQNLLKAQQKNVLNDGVSMSPSLDLKIFPLSIAKAWPAHNFYEGQ